MGIGQVLLNSVNFVNVLLGFAKNRLLMNGRSDTIDGVIMKKLILTAASATVLAFSSNASAAEMIFLWDYQSPTLTGITFQDGSEVQNIAVGPEYTGNYTLFNAQTLLADLDLAFNIFDGGGNVLHTWSVTGAAGSTFFNTPFLNGELGPLQPLAGGINFIADGTIQTVGGFSTGDDNYTLQFRTNAVAAVPEPATWAFMIFGFGAIGGALRSNRRRQRKANVKVSYA